MKSIILRLETAVIVGLPAIALLVVGVLGTRTGQGFGFFLAVLLCIVLVCLGELALLYMTHYLLTSQYSELVEACQEYLAGNTEKRISLHGDTALRMLVDYINALFEAHSPALVNSNDANAVPTEMQEITHLTSASEMQIQLQELIREVAPVTMGDLRIRVHVPSGAVGIIADLCNAFIEELAELISWTRYSSQKFVQDTGNLVEQTTALAQVTEDQMLSFAQTTEAVEKLVVFVQRQSDALQLSRDLLQNVQGHLQTVPALSISRNAEEDESERISSSRSTLPPAAFLDTDIKNLAHLLTEMQKTTHINSTVAESLIADFYSFARRIHQSSVAIIKTAEQMAMLTNLAEQWYASMQAFQIAEPKE